MRPSPARKILSTNAGIDSYPFIVADPSTLDRDGSPFHPLIVEAEPRRR
jgi:hypothetical protein